MLNWSVVQFSYLTGNKRQIQFSNNFVDLSKDSVKNIEYLPTGSLRFLKVMRKVSRKKILFYLNQSKLSLHAVTSLLIATLLQSTKRFLWTLQIFLFQFHVAH